MSSRPVLFVLAAALLAAPLKTEPAQTPSVPAPQISAVHDEWARDWKTTNFEDLRALYAQDAVLLPAVGRAVAGRDAIGDYLKQVIDSSEGAFFFLTNRAEASGDLAYDTGMIQYHIAGNNGPVKGFYVIVLKMNSEGKWVITRQAFTEISTLYGSPS